MDRVKNILQERNTVVVKIGTNLLADKVLSMNYAPIVVTPYPMPNPAITPTVMQTEFIRAFISTAASS